MYTLTPHAHNTSNTPHQNTQHHTQPHIITTHVGDISLAELVVGSAQFQPRTERLRHVELVANVGFARLDDIIADTGFFLETRCRVECVQMI
jgi:hypothetical protein